MKKQTIFISLLILVMLAMAGCGGSAKNSGGQSVYAPKWFAQVENDLFVFANELGISKDERVAYDQAYARAMSGAVLEKSAFVKTSLITNLGSAGGLDNETITQLTNRVSETIGNSRFDGSRVINREVKYYPDEKVYRYWVQVGISKADMLKETQRVMQREEALYNEFKASQALDRMNQSIRELEEKERMQGNYPMR